MWHSKIKLQELLSTRGPLSTRDRSDKKKNCDRRHFSDTFTSLIVYVFYKNLAKSLVSKVVIVVSYLHSEGLLGGKMKKSNYNVTFSPDEK